MDLSRALSEIGSIFLETSAEIVPLFLLAILVGAVIEEFVTERVIVRFLTGHHPGTMFLASLVGALIPLCTCGMVPLAVALRRRGGDVKHTFAFLTAGASVSIPVLLLTGRVLGLGWLAARLGASIAFGLAVGYASRTLLRDAAPSPELESTYDVSAIPARSRLRAIWRCFLSQTREYAPWVVLSLALAAVIAVVVPEHWIHVLYGQKTTGGALLASMSGIPFYFCSGAELPLVKELLAKGMGIGPAAAMMLAVPIVNIPTFGVVSKWLGPRASAVYLALCVAAATGIGVTAGLLYR